MRYLALATDYDGTIAHHGKVDEATVAALERLRASGRRLILVTGRQLDDLISVFPEFELFEWIVAENGALLYKPALREEKLLADAPPPEFARILRERGVTSVATGRAIVATWEPHEVTVLQTIRDLALELQVIFNKGAVMVLPAGVNKATGLTAALLEMGLSHHNVVGVGDAENDHAFLRLCECSVAVSNALSTVKDTADFVTREDHGMGVREVIEELLASDLRVCDDRLTRYSIRLGKLADGSEARLDPCRTRLLIAGPSASGKSTVATSLLEHLAEQQYQFCVIDPEGDYETLEVATTIGSNKRAPLIEEVIEMLHRPGENVVVNLLGVPLQDRPQFFRDLLPELEAFKSHTGRPHWLIVDEAHHLLPSEGSHDSEVQLDWQPTALITVHAELIAPDVLQDVDTMIAVGHAPAESLEGYCEALGIEMPELPSAELNSGEVILWQRGAAPMVVRVTPGRTERRRHRRKYAEGELPPNCSFYFRGPEGKLNLRAQNLITFLQLAEGIDDETWLFHLHEGDYSRWFRARIKDENLAVVAERLQEDNSISATESKSQIKAAIERDYTLPASLSGRKKNAAESASPAM